MLTALAFCVALAASSQKMVYDLSVFGFTFGKMEVQHTVENDSTELYTLHAKGKTNFLWMKREDENTLYVRFRNGKLWTSNSTHIESGVITKWNKMFFDGKLLHVDSYKGKKSFLGAPDYSFLMMYFKPLLMRTRIFHESESDFVNLDYRKDGTVEMKISDGSRTVFHFLNGKIAEMEVHLAIATVHMKLVN